MKEVNKWRKNEFESNLKNLELMVKKLEVGDIPLDQAISDFEKSVALYKQCKNYLDSAEKKITVLNEQLKETEFKE